MELSDLDDLNDFPVVPASSFSEDDFIEALLLARKNYEGLPPSHRKEIGTMSYMSVAREMVRSKGTASALFRRASDTNETLALSWLARARETAEIVRQTNAELGDFKELSPADLLNIRNLAPDPMNILDLQRKLGYLGVILLYVPTLVGMRVDGACFRVSSGNPVIALSLRFRRYDNFWFNLMHELAHILLHYNTLDDPILDDFERLESTKLETEANNFASTALISRSDWRSAAVRYKYDEDTLNAFAKEIGSHPIIVAGRLHRETGDYSIFGELVHRINVLEILKP